MKSFSRMISGATAVHLSFTRYLMAHFEKKYLLLQLLFALMEKMDFAFLHHISDWAALIHTQTFNIQIIWIPHFHRSQGFLIISSFNLNINPTLLCFFLIELNFNCLSKRFNANAFKKFHFEVVAILWIFLEKIFLFNSSIFQQFSMNKWGRWWDDRFW